MKYLSKLIKKTLSPTTLLRIASLCTLVVLGTLCLHPELAEGRLCSSRPALSADRNVDALLYAIIEGDVTRARHVLTNRHPNVNLRDSWGTTALVHAVLAGKHNGPELVRLLIEHGADVNFVDDTGTTPLITAVVLGQKEIATLLLEAGADPNARRANGASALHHALPSTAALEMTEILLAAGADPNARNDRGCKPSQHAREAECDELLRVLEQAESAETARRTVKVIRPPIIVTRVDARPN